MFTIDPSFNQHLIKAGKLLASYLYLISCPCPCFSARPNRCSLRLSSPVSQFLYSYQSAHPTPSWKRGEQHCSQLHVTWHNCKGSLIFTYYKKEKWQILLHDKLIYMKFKYWNYFSTCKLSDPTYCLWHLLGLRELLVSYNWLKNNYLRSTLSQDRLCHIKHPVFNFLSQHL